MEIAATLEMPGRDISSLREFFPNLDEMISRRHKIVHRADLENGIPTPITRSDVGKWASTLVTFVPCLILLNLSPERKATIEPLLERLKAAYRERSRY